MNEDNPAPTEETPVDAAQTPVLEETQVEGGAEAEDEDDEPSEVAQAIAAMGLTRMSLQELKDKSP
ncbi:hypothetical protein ABTC30_19515, partial [Acinetobacter baumannii]